MVARARKVAREDQVRKAVKAVPDRAAPAAKVKAAARAVPEAKVKAAARAVPEAKVKAAAQMTQAVRVPALYSLIIRLEVSVLPADTSSMTRDLTRMVGDILRLPLRI